MNSAALGRYGYTTVIENTLPDREIQKLLKFKLTEMLVSEYCCQESFIKLLKAQSV
jgi:hypothetical protein